MGCGGRGLCDGGQLSPPLCPLQIAVSTEFGLMGGVSAGDGEEQPTSQARRLKKFARRGLETSSFSLSPRGTSSCFLKRAVQQKKKREKKQPPLRFSGLFSRLPRVNKELTFVRAASRWHMRVDARECLGCATAFDGRALCLWIFPPSSDRLADHGGARRTANEEPPPPPRWFTLGVERRRPQNF